MKKDYIIALMISIGIFSGIVFPFNGAGSGTKQDPYQIKNIDQLQEMRDDLDAHYILMNNIDASETSAWNSGDGFEPVPVAEDTSDDPGYQGHAFNGNLDGKSNVITGLYINRESTDKIGLFSSLLGEVKNVGLVDCNISGGVAVGGIAGENRGILSGSCAIGSISGIDTVGGLAGYNFGTISESYSNCKIYGGTYIGGLVGSHQGSTILNSYAIGDVNGDSIVGGLAGEAGRNTMLETFISTLKNSYAVCTVTGNNQVGGLVGFLGETGDVENSFWDVEISGIDSSDGGIGKITAAMKGKSTFTDAGWDFTGVFAGIWDMDSEINSGYPYLRFQTTPLISYFSGGIGTLEDPYRIEDVYQLQNVRYNLDAHYVLVNDIGASATKTWNNDGNGNYLGFEPIGYAFRGSFNGHGHTIDSLYINRESHYTGLFSVITSSAEVTNIGLINCNINGKVFVGGLAGLSGSVSEDTGKPTVSSVYITGQVSGSLYVGGLIGLNEDKISNSFTSVNVSGDSEVGGLAGSNKFGNILNNYSTGDVSGDYNVGGLVGSNAKDSDSATISNSYSIGKVTGEASIGGLIGKNFNGTVENSFWDMETSGIDSSDGGIVKTTDEMKKRSTFVDAGWDFNTIWSISSEENNGYPYLLEIPPNYNSSIGYNIHNCKASNRFIIILDKGNYLKISPEDISPFSKFILTDMRGRKIIEISGNIVNKSDLSQGIYFILLKYKGSIKEASSFLKIE